MRSGTMRVGIDVRQGIGVKQDYAAAVRVVSQGGRAGVRSWPSPIWVIMYESGKGVEKNLEQAVRWYRKAAEQGFALAQAQLGNMYVSGAGVKQDYAAMAPSGTSKPPSKTTPMAQYMLGILYETGNGVAKDIGQGRRVVPEIGAGRLTPRPNIISDCCTNRERESKKTRPKALECSQRRRPKAIPTRQRSWENRRAATLRPATLRATIRRATIRRATIPRAQCDGRRLPRGSVPAGYGVLRRPGRGKGFQ